MSAGSHLDLSLWEVLNATHDKISLTVPSPWRRPGSLHITHDELGALHLVLMVVEAIILKNEGTQSPDHPPQSSPAAPEEECRPSPDVEEAPSSQPRHPNTLSGRYEYHRQHMMEDRTAMGKIEYLRLEVWEYIMMLSNTATLMWEIIEAVGGELPNGTSLIATRDQILLYARQMDDLLNEIGEITSGEEHRKPTENS